MGVHGPVYRALSMQSSQEEAVGVLGAHVFSTQHAVLPGVGGGVHGPVYRGITMLSIQEEAVGIHGPVYSALSMQSSQ